MGQMKRLGGLVLAASTAITAACGSGPGQPAGSAAAPRVRTAEERVARYRECWDYFNKKSWDLFKGCYTDQAESEQVDSGRPPAKGADAIVADAKTSVAGFPDMEGTLQLVLVNSDGVASLAQLNGTNSAAMPGPDGAPVAATNKAIGVIVGHVVRWDATGDKAAREQSYSDTATQLAQLGLSPAPARPVMAKSPVATIVAISSGSATEAKNLAVFRAQMEAFNQHDLEAVESYNATDAVFHDLTAPTDTDRKGNSATLSGFFRGFPDCRLTTPTLWAAGDYVVAQGTFEGTNTGAVPAMGIAKATGKPVRLNFFEITRFEGGQVKDDWLVLESMAMAQQLGLIAR
jgi:predicted ester cyclase